MRTESTDNQREERDRAIALAVIAGRTVVPRILVCAAFCWEGEFYAASVPLGADSSPDSGMSPEIYLTLEELEGAWRALKDLAHSHSETLKGLRESEKSLKAS